MAYAKTTLIILLGFLLGGASIYGIDKQIDATFSGAWNVAGGFAPLFSAWEYLFTGLGGIFLGGITIVLIGRRQWRSYLLMYVLAGYSLSIIAFGMPSASSFIHSQRSKEANVYLAPPFVSVFMPSQDDVDAAERLLLELYWATPLVWSLTLIGCMLVILRQRAIPNKSVTF